MKDRQHNGQKDNQRSTKSPNILSVLGWSPTIKEHKNHYHVHSQINLNNYDIIGVNVSSLVIIKWFVFLELLYWGSHLNSCLLTTSLTPLTRVRAPIKSVELLKYNRFVKTHIYITYIPSKSRYKFCYLKCCRYTS